MLQELLLWVQSVDPRPAHQSLAVQIPEIVGIPLLAFAIVIFVRADEFTPESGSEIGMELAILAAGACGAIFANDTLQAKWGMSLTVYGILVALLCVLFAAILGRVRRRQERARLDPFRPKRTSIGVAILHLILGTIPLGLVTALLVLRYTWNPGR